MPTYAFGSDVLLPYMRETDSDRKPNTRKREATTSGYLLEFFGDILISHSTRGKLGGSQVRQYREWRKVVGKVSPETVKRELALASRACNYAISEWDFDMPNPFQGRLISQRDKAAKKPNTWHVLTPGEEARLLLAAGPLARDVIRFALATGFRQSEIFELTWDRIDGDEVTFTPETQKSNAYGVRILSPDALEVLARQPEYEPHPRLRDPRVFVFHVDGCRIERSNFHKRDWDPARIKAELPDFKFHWLRKTCGQRLLESSGSLQIVQHQLGHREERTTQQAYLKSPLEMMREALKNQSENRGAQQA